MRRLTVALAAFALSLVTGGTLAAEAPPVTAPFGPAGSLAEARFYHTATPLPDGRILVVGGLTIQDGEFVALASAEVWDPATGTFGPAGSLAEARFYHTATLLPDGRILVVGGADSHNVVATAEVWSP
jgi:hypothetical protein